MASADSLAMQSLTKLLSRAALEDHEEVLRASNAVLKKSKSDSRAQHAKVVALLKLEQYDDALLALEEGGAKLKAELVSERAYALYRAGRLGDAIEVAQQCKGRRGAQHVEAQASYRLERFPRVAQLYQELSSSRPEISTEESELRINGGAIDSQLEWSGRGDLVQKKSPSREDLEAFETAYNAACGYIARGEFRQGRLLLKRARDLCDSSTDLNSEEKAAELLPILVQEVYALIRLGQLEEAKKLDSSITISSIPDLSTRNIGQNNSLIVSADASNPYLLHRLFHSTPPLLPTALPFSYQAVLLQNNAYVIDLLSLKHAGVVSSTSRHISQHPPPTISSTTNAISVINAAAHARNATGRDGLRAILLLLSKNPLNIGLLLTAIQLHTALSNHNAAISLLTSFFERLSSYTDTANQDIRHNPGLLALLTSLYMTQSRHDEIRKTLSASTSYWQGRSPPANPPPHSLYRATALALLSSPQAEDKHKAHTLFRHLHTQNPKDPLAAAGIVASSPADDDTQALVASLPKIEELTKGIDAASLEAAGVPLSTTLSTKAAGTKKRLADPSSGPAGAQPAQQKKRFRKSRLPKDYEEGKAVDPERWLPMRERSSFRPRGKKAKAKQAAMTQGGGLGEKEKGEKERLELVGGAGSVKVEKTGGSGSGGAPNKKKKKGGKGKW